MEGAFGGTDVWRGGGKEDLRCSCFGISGADEITLCRLCIGEIVVVFNVVGT